MNWTPICQLEHIIPDTGVCALVAGQQIAVFRQAGTNRLFAVSNYDPACGANVISRGLLAQTGDKLTVASPMLKHHYCLQSGVCLENPDWQLTVYPVRQYQGQIEVGDRPWSSLQPQEEAYDTTCASAA